MASTVALVKKGTLIRPLQWWKRAILVEGAVLILTAYLTAPMLLSLDLGQYLSAKYLENFSAPITLNAGSGFGVRWHPIWKDKRLHTGIDYPAAIGTPVSATRAGVVAFRGLAGGYGRLIRLTHEQGLETRYAHLNKWSPGIHVGITVRAGQIIGYVGESGQATGPHLHYEVRLYGKPLDPDKL